MYNDDVYDFYFGNNSINNRSSKIESLENTASIENMSVFPYYRMSVRLRTVWEFCYPQGLL